MRGSGMDHAQLRKQLSATDSHIAEAKALIARQRAVLARARAVGFPLETPQATLDALESSLLMFEKHREWTISNMTNG